MTRSRIRPAAIALAAIAALSVAAYLGYIRSDGAPQTVTVRAGFVYATSVQAGVRIRGWTYNVPLDVPWVDSTGILHEGSRPSCLPAYKQTFIHFGTVTVTFPGFDGQPGDEQRSVVWVRCP